jgi:dTDP-4-dehydrorhamnose reductase
MKVLLFGAGGQLGRELCALTWPHGLELVAFDRQGADITDGPALRRLVAGEGARLAINAAAYTAVDRAEAEPERAERVNHVGAANLAGACRAAGAALIHVSTDYVFAGDKSGAYRDDDPVAPVNTYGLSKANGETAIRALIDEHVILRTSWLFGAAGQNFVKTMLRLGAARPLLRIVDDQRGCPTPAAELARAIMAVSAAIAGGAAPWGTYHFAGAAPTTWRGFAEAIFAISGALGGPRAEVEPIATADFPTPARRPQNSALDCARTEAALGIAAPDWRIGLAAMIGQCLAASAADARAP